MLKRLQRKNKIKWNTCTRTHSAEVKKKNIKVNKLNGNCFHEQKKSKYI